MARWYQHVFTGQQVEVRTLEEDDQYNGVSAWARIPAPTPTEESKASDAAAALAHHKTEEKDASEAGKALQARKTTRKKA
jgi:hypothetical protein